MDIDRPGDCPQTRLHLRGQLAECLDVVTVDSQLHGDTDGWTGFEHLGPYTRFGNLQG